jgi:murein DD-endopeptidase MepM/ murein hydrolase activator NlpD
VKGYLILGGLSVSIGLLAATLSYVDHRRQAYSSTLVGALGFIERALEASQGLEVEFYDPSIDAASNPGRWALSGIIVTGNPLSGTSGMPFKAVLERRCDATAQSNCWRMEELRVAGVRQLLIRDINTNGEAASQKSAADRLAGSLKRQMADMRDSRRQMMDRSSKLAVVRAYNIADAITRIGLDADRLISSLIGSNLASGGPLIAARDATAGPDPNVEIRGPLRGLNEHWDRLFALQDVLWRLPIAAPLEHYRISSTYGERKDPMTGKWAYHSGLDLVGPLGSGVQATAPGIVTFAGRRGRYGNMIEIDHEHAISTRYGHLREIFVEAGQTIQPGQRIAIMGSSGRSTGPHLHYEIRFQNRTLDPMKFLQAGAEAVGDEPALSTVNRLIWTGKPVTGALLLAD